MNTQYHGSGVPPEAPRFWPILVGTILIAMVAVCGVAGYFAARLL